MYRSTDPTAWIYGDDGLLAAIPRLTRRGGRRGDSLFLPMTFLFRDSKSHIHSLIVQHDPEDGEEKNKKLLSLRNSDFSLPFDLVPEEHLC